MSDASLAVEIDLANPGQYFACCGLLELVARMDGGARGWFDGGAFHVDSASSDPMSPLRRIAKALAVDGSVVIEPEVDATDAEAAVTPLAVTARDTVRPVRLRLDWWLDAGRRPTRLKTWAGQMRVASIVGDLRTAWTPLVDGPVALGAFDRTAPLTGRFGFDPRASWNALDAGFSPNAQGIAVQTAPLVELLAAFGLARFRPVERDGALEYTAWNEPSDPVVAMLRAAGCIPTRGPRFAFRIENRAKYKFFTHARERRES